MDKGRGARVVMVALNRGLGETLECQGFTEAKPDQCLLSGEPGHCIFMISHSELLIGSWHCWVITDYRGRICERGAAAAVTQQHGRHQQMDRGSYGVKITAASKTNAARSQGWGFTSH